MRELIKAYLALVQEKRAYIARLDQHGGELDREIERLRDQVAHNWKTHTIVVEMAGGCVSRAWSDYPNIDIYIRDFDDMQAGDPDPMDLDGRDLDQSDWQRLGYPYEVY